MAPLEEKQGQPTMSLNSSDRLIGIDPSYRRTGICYWKVGSSPSFARIEYNDLYIKDFHHTYLLAQQQTNLILNHVKDYRPTVIVVEHPPPVGQFAGGMYLIVAILLSKLSDYTVYLAPQQVGRTLFKDGRWKKSKSVDVAKKFNGLLS